MLVLELYTAEYFCILGFSCTWSFLGFVSILLLIWQSLVPYPPIASDGNSVFIADSAGIDCMETVVPSSQISSASFFTETQRQFSRYYNEFEELKLLGKGAFGAVIKVWYKNCFFFGMVFGDICFLWSRTVYSMFAWVYLLSACVLCLCWGFNLELKSTKSFLQEVVGRLGRNLSVWGTLYLNCSNFPGERKTSCFVKLFFWLCLVRHL